MGCCAGHFLLKYTLRRNSTLSNLIILRMASPFRGLGGEKSLYLKSQNPDNLLILKIMVQTLGGVAGHFLVK